MRGVSLVLIGLFLSGCGQKGPVQSKGQPVSHWLEALNDPDVKVRKKAVTALGHVGKADPAAIPALAGAVSDPDVEVRQAAVLALLNLGPEAQDAVPVLTDARNDTDARVREYAEKALARIQGED
jgi:HEAT repeat protein